MNKSAQFKGKAKFRKKRLMVFDAPVEIPREQSGWDGRPGWSGAPRPFFIPDPQMGAQRIGQIS